MDGALVAHAGQELATPGRGSFSEPRLDPAAARSGSYNITDVPAAVTAAANTGAPVLHEENERRVKPSYSCTVPLLVSACLPAQETGALLPTTCHQARPVRG